MSKKLVDIDDTVLDQARQVLGTSTIKETVNTALAHTVRAAFRRSVDAASLRRFAGASADLGDPDVMARAWE